MREKIIFLVGATAIGKSQTALYLARKLNAEIISCDSMQIYKGMDILTSKPSLVQKKKIPHHLIDLVNPTKEYNVSRYRAQAIKQINQIIKKGKVPLFVGGTGLYMSVLVDGIFKIKADDKKIRGRLEKEAVKCGSDYLYRKLKKADPLAASKIHPNDARRIIRALEVFRVTGKPISQLQRERKGLGDKYDIRIFCLDMEREALYKRINARVEKMFRQGLVREVKKLLKLNLSRTASNAIGIKELKGFFCGAYDLNAAKGLMQRNTRYYAKRQLTWFRKDKRIQWLKIKDKDSPSCIANKIFERTD
ncbi:MAG: tRNA (adenosine(37)-N6)-dimethylallyltransferase MiaA [Candidatus Omnitrophica bacterium]|nr:tRNA (adenosine(37)-N6)-dimethylallyltransferase MiaA [Candidatus Omnitrophota bacterium]